MPDMKGNGGRCETRGKCTDPDVSRRPHLAEGKLYSASLVAILLFSRELTCGLEARCNADPHQLMTVDSPSQPGEYRSQYGRRYRGREVASAKLS